ncbi:MULTISPECIES: FecR family protein [Butyricimonas]|uniref:FecR family protein n=1 Tax=Butyricimonas TaxID=574697 RepID=UPI000C08C209|nr:MULTISPECIES: FecR family protein [Butyricimonas]MCB6972936.1 DUF4974 domain-containing protein [Butyricimonas synergistica]MCG4518472.1 DUF4974 domain-containing protein [Butyricimonas sp. DFI.6.44]
MKIHEYEITELIYRQFLGELSEEENNKLRHWIDSNPVHKQYYENLFTSYSLEKIKLLMSVDTEEAWKRWNRRSGRQKRFIRLWTKYAAIFILLIGVILVFYSRGYQEKELLPVAENITEGKVAAVLTIDGKEKIVLGENTLVDIPSPEGQNVTVDSCNLSYELLSDKEDAVMHTLDVPRRGEYFVTLSDGTRVWLNSCTRLCYPSYFTGDERRVELEGEAYFEVSKDSTRPFCVVTNDTRVKVYGTEFNLNTRDEKKVRATLVQGKIGITIKNTNEEYLIRPGEMLEYDVETGEVKREDVNTYLYTAWKSGEFVFINTPLKEIMERLCRWYDVEGVFYVNEQVKNVCFTGVVTRFSSIEDVLDILEKTATVKFLIKNKVISVSEK